MQDPAYSWPPFFNSCFTNSEYKRPDSEAFGMQVHIQWPKLSLDLGEMLREKQIFLEVHGSGFKQGGRWH